MVMCWSMRAAASPKGSQLGMCSSATSSSVNAHSLSACPSMELVISPDMLQSLTKEEVLSSDLTGHALLDCGRVDPAAGCNCKHDSAKITSDPPQHGLLQFPHGQEPG